MSEQTYEWITYRERAVELFGQGPDGLLEQRVIAVFREHPTLVIEAIEHVGRRFSQGKIHTPWVILAKHVEQAVKPLEEVSATDERDREKRIRRAEGWMRAAGMHCDRWSEVEDELFGERGLLRMWRSDETLRQRMARLWKAVRPAGELLEQQAEERDRAYRERPRLSAAQLQALRDAEPEPVLDEPEPAPA